MSADTLAARDGEQIVDTRIESGSSCAELATAATEALPVGTSFVLVADHDPAGIGYMLAAEKAGQTSWEVLESGPSRWQARVTRVG